MQSYGTVNIGGKTYIEREQTFPLVVPMTVSSGAVKGSLQLPGVADFWLKTLTRKTLVSGVDTAKTFSFRLGNSDGSTWYQAGGTGGTTDEVLDSLLFGDGRFPFVLTPYIYYSASASLLYNITDLTAAATGTPYSIYFAFRGSYLIPA